MTRVAVYSGTGRSITNADRVVVRHSDGTPYVAIFSNSVFYMYKGNNTTVPTSFSLMDSFSVAAGSPNGFSIAIDSNDDIHCVWGIDNGKNSVYRYVLYDRSAEATAPFQTPEDIFTLAADPVSVGNLYTSIAVDTSDIPHVAVVDYDSNMGTDYATVVYTNRIGGSWKTPVEVEGVTASKQCIAPSIAFSGANVPYIGYLNETDTTLTEAAGNQNNATSFTLTDRDTTANWSPSFAFTSGGTTILGYKDGDNSAALYEGSTQRDSGNGVGGSGGHPQVCAATNGTDSYLFYISDTDRYIAYDKWTGSAWDGETVHENSTAYDRISLKWAQNNDNSQGTYLDVVFEDSGVGVYWDTLTIASGTTISPTVGTIATVGKAVTIAITTAMAPGSGTIATTGKAVTVDLSVTIAPTVGTIATVGQNVDIAIEEVITPATGTITTAGQPVTVAPELIVTPGLGSISTAGQAVTIVLQTNIDPAVGSIATAGQPADMILTTILNPTVGAIALAGQAVDIAQELMMPVGLGSVAVAGQVATITLQTNIDPATGSIATTGQAVIFEQGIVPATGTIATVGQAASISNETTISAGVGSIATAGQAATIVIDVNLDPAFGTIAMTGKAATVDSTVFVSPVTGAIVLAGQAAQIDSEIAVNPGLGAISTDGQAVSLAEEAVVAPATGSIATSGQAMALIIETVIVPAYGAIVTVGQSVTMVLTTTVSAGVGYIVLVGKAVGINEVAGSAIDYYRRFRGWRRHR